MTTFGKPGEVTQMLEVWQSLTGKLDSPDVKGVMSKVNDLLKDIDD